MKKPIVKKISKNHYEIIVIGNRDPRGPDNEITVLVNDKDELVITVPKAYRCYQFDNVNENDNYVRVIAK